jgi:hypothetical protein
MLLDAEMAKLARKIGSTIRRAKTSPREILRLMDQASGFSIPVTYTRGGTLSPFINLMARSSIGQLLDELYLPVNAPPSWIPLAHRYSQTLAFPASLGTAAGHIDTGRIAANQIVNVKANSETTSAGVFIVLQTTRATNGLSSRITFEPEVNWRTYDSIYFTPLSGINGIITFTSRISSVCYKMDAANKFQPFTSRTVQVQKNVLSASSFNGDMGQTGSLHNGALTLQFDATPNQTYLIGVMAEKRIDHQLRDGNTVPVKQPDYNVFAAMGLTNADVPAMWLHQQVLVK